MVKKSSLVAIDLGSNSIRLIGAHPQILPQNSLKIFLRQLKVARVAEDFELHQYLAPSSIERAIQSLKNLISQVQSYSLDQICIVATGVVREAKNQKEFLERIRQEFGIQARVLEGEEEAELALMGVCSTLTDLAKPLLICDIGGGSTEFSLLLREGAAKFSSVPLGAVRLTEKFKISAPMSEDIEQKITDYIQKNLKALAFSDTKIATLVATAGTPTTIAGIDLALRIYDPLKVHGHKMSLSRLSEIYEHLKMLGLEQRRKIPGLESGREDIIVPGTAILLCVMQKFNAQSLTISEGGLLEGVLAEIYKKLWGTAPKIFL